MQKNLFNKLTKKVFFVLLFALLGPITTILAIIGLIQTCTEALSLPRVSSLVHISNHVIGYYASIARYITGLDETPPYPFSGD